MKRLAIAALIACGLVAAGCSTTIGVHTLAPHEYLVCDTANYGFGECNGANPEKGVGKVCLPKGEAIYAIKNSPVQQGIIVVCGPKGENEGLAGLRRK